MITVNAKTGLVFVLPAGMEDIVPLRAVPTAAQGTDNVESTLTANGSVGALTDGMEKIAVFFSNRIVEMEEITTKVSDNSTFLSSKCS